MSDTATILVLNGPNLNMLGSREPGIYGRVTLAGIEARCAALCDALGLASRFEQSNHEGALIDALHAAHGTRGGVALNAGAYTHTSLALADAVRAVDVPVVEVHLSNVHAREPVRHRSMIAPACAGVVGGFGATSYELAIRALAAMLGGERGAGGDAAESGIESAAESAVGSIEAKGRR